MTPFVIRPLAVLAVNLFMFPSLHATSKPGIEDLGWMSGCWESSQGQRRTQEYWMPPAGQTLLGMSRTVVRGKTMSFEFMRIHQDASGIYFTAQPSGQKETAFRLKQAAAGSLVLENPDHDFPQRIIYRKGAAGELLARIEGRKNVQERAIDFVMKRTACE